jgi:glycosyltransferase involved in cell wall biosynthesis
MIVACSSYISKKIGSIVKRELPVVLNGVIFGFKELPTSTLVSLRNTLSITDDKIVFLFAANLIPRKQPQVVINAFNILSEKVKNRFALIILGDGSLMEQCKNLAKNNGDISFVGRVPDLSPYLQISHFYVSASLSEGLPLAVIEAMNHGLGILLSDIPQHAEFFRSNNAIGYLFETSNVNDLERKMDAIIKEDYSEISRNSIRNVQMNFSSEIMSQGLERIYSTLEKRNP